MWIKVHILPVFSISFILLELQNQLRGWVAIRRMYCVLTISSSLFVLYKQEESSLWLGCPFLFHHAPALPVSSGSLQTHAKFYQKHIYFIWCVCVCVIFSAFHCINEIPKYSLVRGQNILLWEAKIFSYERPKPGKTRNCLQWTATTINKPENQTKGVLQERFNKCQIRWSDWKTKEKG